MNRAGGIWRYNGFFLVGRLKRMIDTLFERDVLLRLQPTDMAAMMSNPEPSRASSISPAI